MEDETYGILWEIQHHYSSYFLRSNYWTIYSLHFLDYSGWKNALELSHHESHGCFVDDENTWIIELLLEIARYVASFWWLTLLMISIFSSSSQDGDDDDEPIKLGIFLKSKFILE